MSESGNLGQTFIYTKSCQNLFEQFLLTSLKISQPNRLLKMFRYYLYHEGEWKP